MLFYVYFLKKGEKPYGIVIHDKELGLISLYYKGFETSVALLQVLTDSTKTLN
jgi:hypothetical protein